jgi:hypothetical protein
MKNICGNCGSLDTDKNKTEGSNRGDWFLIICLLVFASWFFIHPFFAIFIFIVGIVIVALLKPRRSFVKCSCCNAENSFIGIDTPKGKELIDKYHKDIEKKEIPTVIKKQTWHGLW